jgi:ABC-type antimicrobial peptide transport system permease subunit
MAAGGELMAGTGLLLVPATAAFMLVVGLLAAAGPARRGLRVDPTEALRAE